MIGDVNPGIEQDAEMASLNNTPDAFKLYDVAVKYVQRLYKFFNYQTCFRLSVNNDWLMEEGYSLYLVRLIHQHPFPAKYSSRNSKAATLLGAASKGWVRNYSDGNHF